MKVCLVTEGTFPVEKGGVATWVNMIIKGIPEIDYEVICVTTTERSKPIFKIPSNVIDTHIIDVTKIKAGKIKPDIKTATEIFTNMKGNLSGESLNINRLVNKNRSSINLKKIFELQHFWNTTIENYNKDCPNKPFSDYYWLQRGLLTYTHNLIEIGRQTGIECDIIHAVNAGAAGLIGCAIKSKIKKPLMITEHGIYYTEQMLANELNTTPSFQRPSYERFYLSLMKTSYENADKITSICNFNRDMEIIFGAKPEKTEVIYNGVNPKQNQISRVENDVFTVGTVTRTTPIKDIECLIKAASIVLKEENVRFQVIGPIQDKKYYRKCKKMAKELGISSNVDFLGYREPSDCYTNMDLFVLSSLSEGMPFALLDAMDYGIPVICTDVGGISEIALDAVCKVPKKDPKSLARNILSLIRNPALMSEIGKKEMELVETQFRSDTMVRKFKKCYIDMCEL